MKLHKWHSLLYRQQRRQPLCHQGFLHRGGFTLLESLAVIAVIAVLATVIIPAVLSVRESSARAKCVSNLRQMGVAFANYAADKDGYLPNNNDAAPGRWYLVLNPYLGLKDSDRSRPSIFICPANDPKTSTEWALWNDVGYWCNLFLMPRATKDEQGNITSWTSVPIRVNNLPSNRVLVADNPKGAGGNSYFKFFRNETEARNNRPYPVGEDGDIHGKARIHGNGVNAMFTDFSIRFMEAEEINRAGSEIKTGAYFGGK